jgi:hypothetical protein
MDLTRSTSRGYSDVQITLNTYAHVLPDMQQGAADRLAAVLQGGG